ncbi:DUF975 family protein [Lactiplantibacillus herbarum]|uniref:DUF975 family protein n=1 Tax=Lactiplantibacillus herbarum TaxID=1670446 RepID=UPI00064FF438|nr:DUF975 family protein [Lactiplantibacillus herbarum]
MIKTRKVLKTEVKQLFKGRWRSAILMCIIVSLLSIFSTASNYSNRLNHSSSFDLTGLESATKSTASLSVLLMVLGFVFVFVLIGALIGGVVLNLIKIGTSYSMLDWVRNPEREVHPVSDSTSGFTRKYAWPIIGITIYRAVLIFLWSLLLVVPGIIKTYAYSQVFYVYKDMLAATPDGQPRPRFRDAMTRSRQLMVGHKWQLFVLQLSFLGWAILSALTAGIGQLWLTPYTYGVFANYYDNLQAVNSK